MLWKYMGKPCFRFVLVVFVVVIDNVVITNGDCGGAQGWMWCRGHARFDMAVVC